MVPELNEAKPTPVPTRPLDEAVYAGKTALVEAVPGMALWLMMQKIRNMVSILWPFYALAVLNGCEYGYWWRCLIAALVVTGLYFPTHKMVCKKWM